MTKNGKFVLKSLLMKGLAVVSVISVGLYTSPYSVVFAETTKKENSIFGMSSGQFTSILLVVIGFGLLMYLLDRSARRNDEIDRSEEEISRSKQDKM
ncbi:hypothetical protein [Erysipelothrix aquatica]|uniref:hypothetical protein n=1 Tax=Erysipelothrix aquatica TaxID=2683714 RepID=UPI00135B93E6|nr:hypothetical protein [Erysipelothrix aquatica]